MALVVLVQYLCEHIFCQIHVLLFFLLLFVFSKRRAIVHDMTCAQWFASTTAVYGRVDTRTIVIFLSLCISA